MAYNYWCSNEQREGCIHCNNRTGNLQINEQGEYTCPNDDTVNLKEMGQTVSGMIAPRMTKGAIIADRKGRSTKHFKKDVLPTLGKDEQRHFGNKFKSQ